MSPFLRQVPTASGATAVQIVSKLRGKRKILEHVGSAHTDEELAALLAVGQQRLQEITEYQPAFDLDLDPPDAQISVEAKKKVVGSVARVLVDTIRACYDHLGFSAVVADEAF